MKRYNPYTATISLAFTELTSDRAKQYYAIRAQQDTQIALDAALSAGIAVYEAAVFTYNLGAFVRAWMHATEQAASTPLSNHAIECTAIVPVASASIAAEEIIDGEIVAESITYQLAPAAPIQLFNNDRTILNAINTTVAALSRFNSIEKTDETIKALAPAKTKTATKKRTPKASAKTATPAPRKSPTRATVGKYSACID
jgi:hypothetical protein